MKHLLPFCSAALIATTAQAQPTLTLATNTPTVGSSYTLNYGPWIAPGGGGGDQTWDLSALGTDSSLTVQYATVASTPSGTQFPTATIAEVNDVVTQYYRVASNGIHFAGSDDGESVIVHAPQGTYLPFPCTIGTTWDSPQNATFTSEDMTVTRTGDFSGQVDGYGTLVMPGGSIPNVLRVHWIHELEDDLGLFTMTTTYDSHAYFVAGQAHPIAEIVTSSVDFGGGTQTRQFSRWTGDVSTHIEAEEAGTIRVFPNPASEDVSITWPAGLGSRAAVLVTDMAGKGVLLGRYGATPGTTTRVDIRALYPGMYQLIILGENGRRTTASLCVN